LLLIEIFVAGCEIDDSEPRRVFIYALKSPDREWSRECHLAHSKAASASTRVYDLPALGFSAGTVARVRAELNIVAEATASVSRGRFFQNI
jgi:hypothetical protein